MMKRGMEEAIDDGHLGKQQWREWRSITTSSADNREEEQLESMPPISGVVVMTSNGSIVSTSSRERQLQGISGNNNIASIPKSADARETTPVAITTTSQQQSSIQHIWSSFPDEVNPMCTSVLLAIQGVSRRERQNALGCGMETQEFQTGQHLCTGYDVYLTKEPNVYEAMALVHSRVRRVIFGVADKGMGGLGGVANSTNSSSRSCENTGVHSLPGTNHHFRAFRLDKNGDNDEGGMKLMMSLGKLHNDLAV